MSVKERLKKFIKSQNITVSGFEKEINVSNGYVNSISKGIGGEILLTILEKFPNLNIEWLLTGNGEMLKNEEKTAPVAPVVAQKTKNQNNYTLQDLKRIASGTMKYSQNQTFTAYESPKGIPLLPFDAFAGFGSDVEGVNFDTIEERYIIPLFEGLKIDFMIPVQGSSMYPKYSSGDVVACTLVKELLFVQWNKVYVLDTQSQGVIIKRIRKSTNPKKITCISDNKDYDPFEIPMSDVRNIALVVGVIRLE